jgi:hypothetical protein
MPGLGALALCELAGARGEEHMCRRTAEQREISFALLEHIVRCPKIPGARELLRDMNFVEPALVLAAVLVI